MPTQAATMGATLYTVTSTYNTFYAIRSHASGMVWSERTESCARALAQEQGLQVVEEADITQAGLRELIVAHEERVERERSEREQSGGHPGHHATPEHGRDEAYPRRPHAAAHSSVVGRLVRKLLRRPDAPGVTYGDRKV